MTVGTSRYLPPDSFFYMSKPPQAVKMTLDVVHASMPQDFEVCKAIRHQVFVLGRGFDPNTDIESYDFSEHTIHFLGREVEINEFVAVARITIDPETREGKLARVGVLKSHQRKGYGTVLLQKVERMVSKHCNTIIFGAPLDKVGFYTRCGYTRVDDTTFFERIEHCWTHKSLVALSSFRKP